MLSARADSGGGSRRGISIVLLLSLVVSHGVTRVVATLADRRLRSAVSMAERPRPTGMSGGPRPPRQGPAQPSGGPVDGRHRGSPWGPDRGHPPEQRAGGVLACRSPPWAGDRPRVPAAVPRLAPRTGDALRSGLARRCAGLHRHHDPASRARAPRLRAGARQLQGVGAHRRLSARAAGVAPTRRARAPGRVGPTARPAALAVARSASGSLPRPGGRGHGEAVRAAYPEPRRLSEKGSSGVTVVRAPAGGRS